MKYTVTKKEEKEVQLAPETLLAISSFKKLLVAQASLEKREAELEMWLSEVPMKDMEAYVEITEEMSK